MAGGALSTRRQLESSRAEQNQGEINEKDGYKFYLYDDGPRLSVYPFSGSRERFVRFPRSRATASRLRSRLHREERSNLTLTDRRKVEITILAELPLLPCHHRVALLRNFSPRDSTSVLFSGRTGSGVVSRFVFMPVTPTSAVNAHFLPVHHHWRNHPRLYHLYSSTTRSSASAPQKS